MEQETKFKYEYGSVVILISLVLINEQIKVTPQSYPYSQYEKIMREAEWDGLWKASLIFRRAIKQIVRANAAHLDLLLNKFQYAKKSNEQKQNAKADFDYIKAALLQAAEILKPLFDACYKEIEKHFDNEYCCCCKELAFFVLINTLFRYIKETAENTEDYHGSIKERFWPYKQIQFTEDAKKFCPTNPNDFKDFAENPQIIETLHDIYRGIDKIYTENFCVSPNNENENGKE